MKPFTLNIKGRLHSIDRPQVMAVVNVTDDSFYKESRVDPEAVLSRVEFLLCSGADMIDVGACSTRPGSRPVSEEVELKRLGAALPLVREYYPEVIISVDTFRPAVARKAVEEWGADIINDVSQGKPGDAMFETVAALSVPYVLCHNSELSDESVRTGNIVADTIFSLAKDLRKLRLAGVSDVIVDPGFGFAKTLDQNFEILRDLSAFDVLDCPILAGVSRKSMATKLLGIDASEALNATTVMNTIALQAGAAVLRVHDPLEAREAITIYQKTFTCHPSE